MTSSKSDFEFGRYLGFVLKEISGTRLYVNAALIGFIICFFTDNYSLVPFIVPLFVQVLARSNIQYRQRHLNTLVELPAQAEAPVFIMDLKGNILLSVGKTRQLFQQHGVTNVTDFLNQKALDDILEISQPKASGPPRSIEAISGKSMRWYEINAARMEEDPRSGHVLVWFQDISLRKNYDFRLQDLLRYSGELIHDLENLVDTGAEFEHLASFLLMDYEAVFITRADRGKNLSGSVFKLFSNKIEQSAPIVIPNESLAPINVSRKKAQIITDDIEGYDTMEAFLEKNPLDPRVLAFINAPIHNFITYNEADLSIIAFNYKSKITNYEQRFFEILVNYYRAMIMMVDLERKSKQQNNL